MSHRITLAEARTVLSVSVSDLPRHRRAHGAAVAFVRARAEVLNRMGGMAAWMRLAAASRTLEKERTK
jgi:hypothetical protein